MERGSSSCQLVVAFCVAVMRRGEVVLFTTAVSAAAVAPVVSRFALVPVMVSVSVVKVMVVPA